MHLDKQVADFSTIAGSSSQIDGRRESSFPSFWLVRAASSGSSSRRVTCLLIWNIIVTHVRRYQEEEEKRGSGHNGARSTRAVTLQLSPLSPARRIEQSFSSILVASHHLFINIFIYFFPKLNFFAVTLRHLSVMKRRRDDIYTLCFSVNSNKKKTEENSSSLKNSLPSL